MELLSQLAGATGLGAASLGGRHPSDPGLMHLAHRAGSCGRLECVAGDGYGFSHATIGGDAAGS